ncbi:MAG: molybdopterin-dependent oxidoreductase [Bacteroidetes bacterium]|nr:molybdopterin-dependent oxidoreductase [Bacteroidota bacterium]MCW5894940.1 molybdopterin-dependent oxidoreductase [Bacteroidota bacterium]
MNSLSRRRFLKISGATIGVAAAGTAVLKGTQLLNRKKPAADVETIPTYCDICFWKCGAIAHVKDGQLWKVEGNPNDPLSNGRLCPRGTGGVGAHYDPDRLKVPLIRKSNRGKEEWVEVTWDEAFMYIAEKMQKIKAQHGPESVALFSHGIGGNFFKHTLKAFGTPNISAPSFAQCRGPRDVGFRLTFGEDVSSPERTDIKNARCLVLIGSHLGENMHNTQVQEFAEAIENGASIIVVDPRFSVAASKAKHYLPIKPGTDLALLLAWMNVIVNERLYDVEYVQKYGFGFDQFAASLQQYTPEWAYPESGIEPEVIRETAREMARFKPATLVHPGRHVTWYGDDAQRSRAIALLNALLGSWGRKGGFYTPVSMDVPAYPYPPYPKSEKGKVDNPDHKYPFAHETITTGIREATITGKPYPVKGWFVYATNLLHALPNEEETIKAIQNLDLLVVIDVIPSEIAGWADVVLPESVYLERFDDLNVEWFREPFVALRQPVVESPHDQKPNWWMAKKLAEKLGLGHYYPWNDIEEYFEYRLKAAGLSYSELKQKGIIRGSNQPIYFDEGVPAEFPTPSGKIEFYSLQLQQAGFDPVPKYTRPASGPPGYLRLLYGRAPVHSFSRTQSNRVLMDMMSENEIWINAAVAERFGVKSGDYVRLKNQDGVVSNKIKVKATERIRPDCAYMVHGFGHNAKGLKFAYGKGASDAQLLTRYVTDPLMGGTASNMNFVTIESEVA